MMAYLSKAALALTLATATPLAMARKADFAADANSSSFFNGGKTRVIVGYNDDMAAGSFAITLQNINGNSRFIFQEVSNRKFKSPQKVVLPDVDSMSITEEDGWGWVQEGAISTGYSVLEFESSDVNAQMDLLSSVLRDIPGVVSVEKDGMIHALSLSTQKPKNLRDGEAVAAAAVDLDPTPMQVQDSQDVIKASNGQFTETGNEANHAGRRLVESIPYGINMVASAYVNAKPDPVGAQPITICVVDTGYDLGHVDLPNTSHGVDGFSPYGSGELWDVDGDGHGTHCAGTIGAIGDNGIGVTSVNPDPTKFKFYIGKGIQNSGSGSWSGLMASINACVDNGAKVISMSLGGPGFITVVDNLMKDHYDNGVLLIAAAGNGGSSAPLSYPASYGTVASVAAVDINEDRASFSETNDQVELSGPGVGVLSTFPGDNLAYSSGTSMACPHVAGVAALIWYHFPDCTNNQIRNVLILSSKDLGASSWDSSYGWGLVNATTAYNLLESQGCEAGGPSDFGRPLHEVALGGKDQLSMLPWAPSAQPSLSAQPSSCSARLQVNVNTDEYPGETHWSLTDSSGTVVKSVDAGFYTNAYTSYTTEFCIDICEQYTFTIFDTYGDGQSCPDCVDGSYSVTVVGGSTVASGGGDWGDSESTTFDECAPSAQPSSQPSLSAQPSDEATSSSPSEMPSSQPSESPSDVPSSSSVSSAQPSAQPSAQSSLSAQPSAQPSFAKSSKRRSKTSKSPFATSLVGNEMKSSAAPAGGSSTLVALLAIVAVALGANYFY